VLDSIYTSASSPFTISGLTNGTSYTINIVALNAIGTSAPASITGIPVGTPGAVTNLTGTPANNSASLSWEAPSDTGGVAIASYRIDYQIPATGAVYFAITSLRTYILTSGLTNGANITFTVTANNGVYTGPSNSVVVKIGIQTSVPGPVGSFSSAGAPNSIPGSLYLFQGTQTQALAMLPAISPTVTNLTTGGTANGILMVWITPTTNGGSPIDYYLYIYRIPNRSDHLNYYSPIPTEVAGTTVYAIWQSPIVIKTTVTVIMAAHNANGFSSDRSRTYYFP
jgi:hypothetical protein